MDMRIQRGLEVSEASPVSSVITDDDVTYTGDLGDAFSDGDYVCGPCKWIAVARNGIVTTTTTLRLTWSGGQPLTLWAGQGWGVPVQFTARPGESEITATVTGQRPQLVLVGVDSRASSLTGGPWTFTPTIRSQ